MQAIAAIDQEALADLAEQGSTARPRPPRILQALVDRSLAAGLLLGIEGHGPGTVWGYLAASLHGPFLHVDELAVERARRRRGLGSALIEAAKAECTARQLSAITLTTDCIVPANVSFYESHGFETIEAMHEPIHVADAIAAEKVIFKDPARRAPMIWRNRHSCSRVD